MAAAAPAPAAAPDPAAEPSPPAAKAASPIGASPIGRESVHTHTSGDAAANAAYYAEFKPRFALGRGQFGVAYLLQHKDGHKAVDKRIHLDGLKEEDRANTWKEIELLRRAADIQDEAHLEVFPGVRDGDTERQQGQTPSKALLHEEEFQGDDHQRQSPDV